MIKVFFFATADRFLHKKTQAVFFADGKKEFKKSTRFYSKDGLKITVKNSDIITIEHDTDTASDAARQSAV